MDADAPQEEKNQQQHIAFEVGWFWDIFGLKQRLRMMVMEAKVGTGCFRVQHSAVIQDMPVFCNMSTSFCSQTVMAVWDIH